MFGKPRIRIPWKTEDYLGETSKTDGYTTDWSDPEEESTAFSYFMEQFVEAKEADFQFSLSIPEMIRPQVEEKDQKQLEDRSLGETDVSLSLEWIRQQIEEGELPPIGLTERSSRQWNEIRVQPEEQEPDRIKNIVNSLDYEKVEVVRGK